MPQIKSSFTFNSKEPNFTRDRFETWDEMNNIKPNHIDVGHISYCSEKQRHYVWTEQEKWKELSSFSEYPSFDTRDEILEEGAGEKFSVGQLVYCKEDDQMYYNTKDHNFKLLVDMQESNYISESDDAWKDINEDVSKLESKSNIIFETIEEMKLYEPGEDDPTNEGIIAYCTELKKFFYYTPSETSPWYGNFKIVCDKESLLPIISDPNITIELENYIIRNDERVLVVEKSNDDELISLNDIIININHGLVDYSNFPYRNDLEETYNYISINEGDTVTDIKNTDIVLGDVYYHVDMEAKANADIHIPRDINGLEQPDLKWKDVISSNDVIVNYTLPWYASTENSIDLIKQPLLPWDSEMSATAVLLPSVKRKQQFQIPTGRILKGLYIKAFGQWVEEDMNNYTKNDNTYTYNGEPRGSVEIKLIF